MKSGRIEGSSSSINLIAWVSSGE